VTSVTFRAPWTIPFGEFHLHFDALSAAFLIPIVFLSTLCAVYGVLGVLFALAQHDLKRLLAYHSVENIGIIALGMGAGLLGMSYSSPVAAVLGFAGSLLHVFNHAVFKGLLFLCAGSVQHAAGTRDIEKLGGLLKTMPSTGLSFLTGSAAITGLPPLNGFISEWLIYAALFKLTLMGGAAGGVAILSIVSLALIGTLALACFTKAFGVVFLGEPRVAIPTDSHVISGWMLWPMAMLSLLCLAIGAVPMAAFQFELSAAMQVAGAPVLSGEIDSVMSALSGLTAGIWTLIGLGMIVWILRAALAAARGGAAAAPDRTVTWDCGYAHPTPRMQYTASSFVQPLTSLFQMILRPKVHQRPPVGYFAPGASFESHTPDLAADRIFGPLFTWVTRLSTRVLWIQQGRIQAYLLYLFAALTALLAWHLSRV